MTRTVLGIIGGSGVYDIAGLEGARWERVKSPWGEACDELLFGTLSGVDMVFLPRHGRGHVQSPTSINYRANIDVLKRAASPTSFRCRPAAPSARNCRRAHFVIVDQFIDRTHAREKTFFGKGFVAHVSIAHPICPKLADALTEACAEEKIPHSKRRHLSGDGRPAILHAGRKQSLSLLGLQRHRHDGDARSQARARSRTCLTRSWRW